MSDLPRPDILTALPGLGGVPADSGGQPGRLAAPGTQPADLAEQTETLLVQPVPSPQACVVPAAGSLERERRWLRQTMSQEYDAASSSTMRLLSEVPGLRGATRESAAEALTDLVAVRLYLTGQAQRVDEAVRAAEPGPHVPFARCVASGLRRLPSYRGVARLCAPLTDREWKWYGERQLVTEWAFCPAVADSQARLPGTVDFWIWSTTARRVHMVAPGMQSQVVFLPGTHFKVLKVRSEVRREVLLRELLSAEIRSDGEVRTAAVPLDDVALSGLERAMAAAASAPGTDLPPGYAGRFTSAPGLITTGRTLSGEEGEAICDGQL